LSNSTINIQILATPLTNIKLNTGNIQQYHEGDNPLEVYNKRIKTMMSTIPIISTLNTSTQIIENKKRPQHIRKEIQVLAWDRHNNVVGLNQ
jgi:hypothetical protein